ECRSMNCLVNPCDRRYSNDSSVFFAAALTLMSGKAASPPSGPLKKPPTLPELVAGENTTSERYRGVKANASTVAAMAPAAIQGPMMAICCQRKTDIANRLISLRGDPTDSLMSVTRKARKQYRRYVAPRCQRRMVHR